MLTHTREKPHKCTICDKSFGRKGHLEGHMLTHSGEKSHNCASTERPFKCGQCNRSFKVDLSENISSCTLELSHTSVKYATNHLSVSITWYTTLESTAGKGLSSAENAVSPSTNVYISRHISSLTLEQSHSSVRSVRNQFRNRVTWKGTCTVSIAHPH